MSLAPVGVALATAGVVLCGVALLTFTRRDSPAAAPFAVTTAVLGTGSLALGGASLTQQPTSVSVAVAVGVSLLFPVPWLLFSLRYTGQNESVSSQLVTILAMPIVVGLLATATILSTQFFSEVVLPSPRTVGGLTAMATILLTMIQLVSLLYAGGVTIVASGLLLWTFHRYDYLDATTGTLLGTFGTVPWLSILLGFQMATDAPLALPRIAVVGFVVGALTAAGAVSYAGLFDRVPAAGNIGPRTLFEEIEEPVVVTDDTGTVVTLNDAADRRVDVGRVGVDVERLLDVTLEALRETDTVALRSDDGRRLFEPTLSPLSDQQGSRFGYAIVLRDVTDRTTRQQRLEVLNRVLRHNLRNDMNVVLGHAERLRAEVDDDALESADTVIDTGNRLLHFAEEAQAAERLMSDTDAPSREIRLQQLAHTALAAVEGVEKPVEYSHDVPDGVVVVVPPELLERALTNLVENAVEHNGQERPWVRLRGDYDPDRPYPLHIAVDDDGPGIPEHERKVLEAGTETALEHGSGLGLWIVRWAVTRLGGEIEFTQREPRGTSVVLRLPNATADESA